MTTAWPCLTGKTSNAIITIATKLRQNFVFCSNIQ